MPLAQRVFPMLSTKSLTDYYCKSYKNVPTKWWKCSVAHKRTRSFCPTQSIKQPNHIPTLVQSIELSMKAGMWFGCFRTITSCSFFFHAQTTPTSIIFFLFFWCEHDVKMGQLKASSYLPQNTVQLSRFHLTK